MNSSAYESRENSNVATGDNSRATEVADRLRSALSSPSLPMEIKPPTLVAGGKGERQLSDNELILSNAFADTRPEPKSVNAKAQDTKLEAKDNNGTAKAPDKNDEVVHQWYGLGKDTGLCRVWNKVTRGEWEKRAHDLAKDEVSDVMKDINKHTSGSDRRADSEHLISALQHAKAHLSEKEFDQIIKDLPGRTGNKVYSDGSNLKLEVPWSIRNPVIYEPGKTNAVPYDIRSKYSTLTPDNFR